MNATIISASRLPRCSGWTASRETTAVRASAAGASDRGWGSARHQASPPAAGAETRTVATTAPLAARATTTSETPSQRVGPVAVGRGGVGPPGRDVRPPAEREHGRPRLVVVAQRVGVHRGYRKM